MPTNPKYFKNKQVVTMHSKSIKNCEVLVVGINPYMFYSQNGV